MRHLLAVPIALALTAFIGCDSTDDPSTADAASALTTYADIVHATYADALAGAEELDAAVDAFVAAPSADGLEAAKRAWLDAREPYGQTEAFRFSGGPIDDADGPEGC